MTFLFIISAILMVAFPAAGSERDDDDWRNCGELTRSLLASADTSLERRFVRCLGEYGFRRFDEGARTRIAGNVARFEPLIVAAQQMPYMPDPVLLEWFFPRVSRTGAEALREAMLAWLKTPEPIDARGSLLAAQVLTRLTDRRAIVHLRTLVEPAQAYPWNTLYRDSWHLDNRAQMEFFLLHLEDSVRAEVLNIRPKGRLAVARPLSEVESAAIAIWWNERQRSEWPVAVREMDAFWRAVHNAPASRSQIEFPVSVLQFRDPAATRLPRDVPRTLQVRFWHGLTLRFWAIGQDTVAFDHNGFLHAEGPASMFEKLGPRYAVVIHDRKAHDALRRVVEAERPDPPRPDYRPVELELPFLKVLTRSRDPVLVRRFIEILGVSSFYFNVGEEEKKWMALHFRRFAPIMLRAQRPFFQPDRQMIDWLLARGSPEEREAVIAQLLQWLDPADPIVSRSKGGWSYSRAFAAVILADVRENRAAPLLAKLLETRPSNDQGSRVNWMWLSQSYLRLTDSTRVGFIVPSPSGELAIHRDEQEVERIVTHDPSPIFAAETLSTAEANEAWQLVTSSRSEGDRQYEYGLFQLRIEFRDGLSAEVFVNDRGELYYNDSAQPGSGLEEGSLRRIEQRPPLRLQNPALKAFLENLNSRSGRHD